MQRSDMGGWAQYGYCASHSRFLWGLRLYLVCTPTGMPIMWALASAKIGEREVLSAMLEVDAGLVAARSGILLISDKGFASKPAEGGRFVGLGPHLPLGQGDGGGVGDGGQQVTVALGWVRGAGQCLAVHRDRRPRRRAGATDVGVVAFGQVGADRGVQGIAVEGGQE
ncbi:hypothetical protein ABZT30_54270, partial [Streptomyces mirabilis]